jgi:Protein of unknown function (DUF3800)
METIAFSMLVLIDESGDPGIKLDGGSSEYLVVTLVLFEDHDEALEVEKAIEELRAELRLSPNFEFHFTNLKHAWRESFLKKVSGFDWFYFSIVINKSRLSGPGFQLPDSFYKYTCSLVFQNAKPHLTDAVVVIDGSGARKFRRELCNYLRKRVNPPDHIGPKPIKKVKVQESHANPLLQLADLVCGSVARDYNKPQEGARFRKLISHREMHVQVWPK